MNQDLNIQKMADLCGVHKNTIRNYEHRGIIKSYRDHNNFRRYPWQELEKLKIILSARSSERG